MFTGDRVSVLQDGRKFCGRTVLQVLQVMAAEHCECAHSHETVHILVKMVSFVLSVFYHDNKNGKNTGQKGKPAEAVASLRKQGDCSENGGDLEQETDSCYDSPGLTLQDCWPFTPRLLLQTHGHYVLPSDFVRTGVSLTERVDQLGLSGVTGRRLRAHLGSPLSPAGGHSI